MAIAYLRMGYNFAWTLSERTTLDRGGNLK